MFSERVNKALIIINYISLIIFCLVHYCCGNKIWKCLQRISGSSTISSISQPSGLRNDSTECCMNSIIRAVASRIYVGLQRISSCTTISSKSRPSGLKNNSTECYMNSIIQAVASSDKLIGQFKTIQSDYQNYPNSESLNYFLELLQSVNEYDDSYDHLCKNTDLLEKLIGSVNWTKPSQQDAFELLSALVNGIHHDLKLLNLENFEMPMKFKIVHRLKGMNIPNKFQYQIGLTLGLCGEYSTGVTIEYLVNQYFNPTIIDDDPNKTSQIFLYRESPDVLLLHIQANKWDNEKGEMVKPKYYIKYDEEICLCLNIVQELDDDEFEQFIVNYKIKAVVQHTGTIDGGHYITYRKWNNKWFSVNDEHVKLMEFNKNICPYIMIYEKC